MNTHVQTDNDRSMHMTAVADRATRTATATTGENVTAIDKNTKNTKNTKTTVMTEVNVPFELVHAAAACASTDITRPMLTAVCVKWAGIEIDEGRPAELVACATDSHRMVIIGLGVDQARALEMLDDDKTDGVLIPSEVHGLKLGKATRLRRSGVGAMINVNAGMLTVEMPPSTMRCKAMANVSQFPKVRNLFPKIPDPVAGDPGMYRDGATEALRPLVVPCGLNAGYVGSFDTVGQRMQHPYGTKPAQVRDMQHRPWRMVFAPDTAKPTVWSSSGEGSYTWQAWALLMPVRS